MIFILSAKFSTSNYIPKPKQGLRERGRTNINKNHLETKITKVFSDMAYSLDHYIYYITNDVLLWTATFGDT